MASDEAAQELLLPGVDGLDNLDQICVRQPRRTKEMLIELFCGWEIKNRFEVGTMPENKDDIFKPIFYLKEDSECCMRQ